MVLGKEFLEDYNPRRKRRAPPPNHDKSALDADMEVTAAQVREGADIQGLKWPQMGQTRAKMRLARLRWSDKDSNADSSTTDEDEEEEEEGRYESSSQSEGEDDEQVTRKEERDDDPQRQAVEWDFSDSSGSSDFLVAKADSGSLKQAEKEADRGDSSDSSKRHESSNQSEGEDDEQVTRKEERDDDPQRQAVEWDLSDSSGSSDFLVAKADSGNLKQAEKEADRGDSSDSSKRHESSNQSEGEDDEQFMRKEERDDDTQRQAVEWDFSDSSSSSDFLVAKADSGSLKEADRGDSLDSSKRHESSNQSEGEDDEQGMRKEERDDESDEEREYVGKYLNITATNDFSEDDEGDSDDVIYHINASIEFESSEDEYEIYDPSVQPLRSVDDYFEFYHNTRRVQPTKAHSQLTDLVWATSQNEVYVMNQKSVVSKWSATSRQLTDEVISQAGTEILLSTFAVKDNFLVGGGIDGDLIFKRLDKPSDAHWTKMTDAENSITTSVEIHDRWGCILVSNNDTLVRAYDVEAFDLRETFKFPFAVNTVSLSPDAKMMVVGGDGSEGALGVLSEKKVEKLRFEGSCHGSAWHPSGVVFATTSSEGKCRVWDVRNTMMPLHVLKAAWRYGTVVKFSSDGELMVVGEKDDFVNIYSATLYEAVQRIDFIGGLVGVSFSPDEESLFLGICHPNHSYSSLMTYHRKHS